MPLYVPLAWYGTIEIHNDIKNLYHHYLVQRLRWLSQLGEKVLDNPSATQNRLTHSLRVCNETKNSDIVKSLPQEMQKALTAYALVHDTPHSPLSHTLEAFFGGDHDASAKDLVLEFRQTVEADGVDFEIFKALFLHQTPEHKIVSDKNFGTDKLDYLKFDALHSGTGNVPNTNFLQHNLAFRNGRMMAHISAIEDAKELQKKYLYSYLHLYTSVEVMTWQRLSQKIAHYCFLHHLFSPADIRMWVDHEFWGAVARASYHGDREIKELYQAIKYARTPVPVIDFLPGNHPYFYEHNNAIVREAMREKYFVQTSQWKSMETILRFETILAGIADLEPWQIIIACQDQPEKRFVPTDCTVFNDLGDQFSLFGLEPKHFDSMLESARKSMFIRIAVVEKNPGDAEKAKKAVCKIRQYLESHIDEIVEK